MYAGSPSGEDMLISGFLLSLVSPVFHRMVCGPFKERDRRRLELEDVAKGSFVKLMDLACGKDGLEVSELLGVVELAKLADRFQMTEVASALENVVVQHLTVQDCVEVLMASSGSGLCRIEEGSRGLALLRFEEVVKTTSFIGISEDVLGSLLDDEGLVTEREEAVFEAVVAWIVCRAKPWQGEALLRKIRFPFMDEHYLSTTAAVAIPESSLLQELTAEALEVKNAAWSDDSAMTLRSLGELSLVPRIGRGVPWERYVAGGERRLCKHIHSVYALAECVGRVCSGSCYGRIRVWNKATLEEERLLQVGNDAGVWSLTAWEGRLISGHDDGRLRVWDVAAGRCDRVLEGPPGWIYALAVCGARLLAGSDDGSIKVWRMGGDAEWPCERRLLGHTKWVLCLGVWRGRVVSGSGDCTMRVWDVESGAHEATLEGHTGAVMALVFHGLHLYSSSQDGTIRVWVAGTWEATRVVQAYPRDSDQYSCCLAVSGSRLVSGSASRYGAADEGVRYEVRVWDLVRLECLYSLRQPPGAPVSWLLAVDCEVWGGVGEEVVVWGRT